MCMLGSQVFIWYMRDSEIDSFGNSNDFGLCITSRVSSLIATSSQGKDGKKTDKVDLSIPWPG